MNRLQAVQRLSRGFASAAPKSSTGIEHAEQFAKLGGKKPDWKLYKVQNYLNNDKYTYYQAEIELQKYRLPQPSNKKPDVLPKVKVEAAPAKPEVYKTK
ncbi:unnamed protein product [Cylicocyclus nassatus]|uniref:Complex I-9kD n=1 Tax=Cylicocyclus nassatus TaxID=53992 RepID=A0AA36H3K5_CYLNA|nr:unnamed protein product [Cylicocyclus nassatus]